MGGAFILLFCCAGQTISATATVNLTLYPLSLSLTLEDLP
jgi:hypothetical protein